MSEAGSTLTDTTLLPQPTTTTATVMSAPPPPPPTDLRVKKRVAFVESPDSPPVPRPTSKRPAPTAVDDSPAPKRQKKGSTAAGSSGLQQASENSLRRKRLREYLRENSANPSEEFTLWLRMVRRTALAGDEIPVNTMPQEFKDKTYTKQLGLLLREDEKRKKNKKK